MAVDVAIYAALSAAWHYKWLRAKYSRLLRPDEYDETRGNRLRVLFERNVDECGQDPGMRRDCPDFAPGTPRHPAWPSGHSTFSAVASHVLEYFFSPETLEVPDATLFAQFPPTSTDIGSSGWVAAELRRLANNIGEARMWAGVHWLDDHVAGQKIGRSAAQAVIEQLKRDCVPDFMIKPCNSTDMPPDNNQIAADANRGGRALPRPSRRTRSTCASSAARISYERSGPSSLTDGSRGSGRVARAQPECGPAKGEDAQNSRFQCRGVSARAGRWVCAGPRLLGYAAR